MKDERLKTMERQIEEIRTDTEFIKKLFFEQIQEKCKPDPLWKKK